MSDDELREIAASRFAALRETNASIQAANTRMAYTEDEARADRVRIRRLEEAMKLLIQSKQNAGAHQDVADARTERLEKGHEEMQRALTRLTNTVERYINARSTNGDKPE